MRGKRKAFKLSKRLHTNKKKQCVFLYVHSLLKLNSYEKKIIKNFAKIHDIFFFCFVLVFSSFSKSLLFRFRIPEWTRKKMSVCYIILVWRRHRILQPIVHSRILFFSVLSRQRKMWESIKEGFHFVYFIYDYIFLNNF